MSIFRLQAMDLEAYSAGAGEGVMYAYDLDNDGFFERIRFDEEADGEADIEYTTEGEGMPFSSRELPEGAPVWV